ncbi:hypothetical protein COHA_004443 [Chlorella ohadii]|uniref:Uncharacterized protein n=1 Tax=Chlorella ohadii TaxID=2649997 RepID=A0AAD5DQ51_9CHLO|nr:hypothetical protein COHA_004443 [Chlorella ohadii]
MTWTEEVSRNRILVLKASRDSGRAPPLHQLAKKRLRPAAQPPAPNSGLGAIAVAAGLLASAVMWNREGHKLKGRQLPAWLEPLRPLLAKLGGTRGSQPRRSSSSSASSAAARQEQQRRRQEQERRQQEQRALAAAAAEQRLQAAAATTAASGSGGKKGGGKKGGGKGKGKKKR